MPLQKVDELAEVAMTAHHQQGEYEKALEAARLIQSVPRRAAKLQFLGYWKELADVTQVIHKPLPSLHTTSMHSPCRTQCRLPACRLESLGRQGWMHCGSFHWLLLYGHLWPVPDQLRQSVLLEVFKHRIV